jgi:hypothetical protein
MKRQTGSAFGQTDPTDGRNPYEWKSKYDPIATKEIYCEAAYLFVLLFGLPLLMVFFWLDNPERVFHLPQERYRPLLKYLFAWISGSLGGVIFDLKWLYHVVARGLWHQDRRLWRIFTPHISGGLSFFVLALVASGGLRIFDSRSTDSLALVIGQGFFVGYFSDSAIAKLSDIAETLFGTTRSKEKHREKNSQLPQSKTDDKAGEAGAASE